MDYKIEQKRSRLLTKNRMKRCSEPITRMAGPILYSIRVAEEKRLCFENSSSPENVFLRIEFRVLSYLGTGALQLREKETWMLVLLAADLGIMHTATSPPGSRAWQHPCGRIEELCC